MPDCYYLKSDDLAKIRDTNPRRVDDKQVLELANAAPMVMGGTKKITQSASKMVETPGDGKAPLGELGSSWDRDRLYAFYEDGLVFEDGPFETADIEDMLRRDGKARSIEQALTLPIRSADYNIVPAKGDNGESEFVTDALTRSAFAGGMETPLQTIIGQMTSAFLFRRAHFEKVFRADPDGKIRYQNLAYRMPTTCYLARRAEDAKFAGFMQWTWKGQEFLRILIPAEKSFVYIHGEHRNPLVGVSDLDVCWTAFQSKQKIRFLWYQFLETQAGPRTVAKAGSGTKTAAELAKTVAGLRGGGVVGIDATDSVEVIEGNGSGAAGFQAAIAYLDSEQSESVLAGFLDLTSRASGASGGTGRGSNALAKSMQDFFNDGRQGAMNEVAAAITNGVIADLIQYNFGSKGALPTFEFAQDKEDETATQAISMLQAIAVAPSMNVLPWGFIDLLTEKVAELLELPVDQVHSILQERAANASQTPADTLAAQGVITPESAKLHNAVGAAHALVTQHPASPAALPPANVG